MSFIAELKSSVVICIATHFFTIKPENPRARSAVYAFAAPLLEYVWTYDVQQRRNVRVAGKVWGGSLSDYSTFRYPISLLPKMKRMLEQNNVLKEEIQEIFLPVYAPAPANIQIKPHFKLRDYQEEAHAFTDEVRAQGHPSTLIAIYTGGGKTVTLLAYAAKLGLRTAMVCSASYTEKWVNDIVTTTLTDKSRILVVQGREAIRKIFHWCEKEIFDYDFVIFSTETLQRYFKEYEENPELCAATYGGLPMDIWGAMKIGFLGGDEMHESINTIYWLHTFVHGPFHMALSATMMHKDQFIETRQKEIYPLTKRFDKIKMEKYINLVYVGYRFNDIEKSRIRTSFPRRTTYSQDAYEQSILNSKVSKGSFGDMIVRIVEDYFIKSYQPGDKLRLYFSRINSANYIVDRLRKAFPGRDVRRYVEDDDYQVVIDSEICVTNRGKAGTAVDIPGLTTVINFTNIESPQAVLQLLGRLRKIPGKEVFFVQMYCQSIRKHLQYKDTGHPMLAERVARYVHHQYPVYL